MLFKNFLRTYVPMSKTYAIAMTSDDAFFREATVSFFPKTKNKRGWRLQILESKKALEV